LEQGEASSLNECAGKWSRFGRSNDRKVVLPAWVDWVSIEGCWPKMNTNAKYSGATCLGAT
jgi:hypothetical protein